MFELFDHTADLGLLVRADTPEGLFVEAAAGFRAMVLAADHRLSKAAERRVRLQGDASRLDELWFDWLSELLLLFETEHFLAAAATVQLEGVGTGAPEKSSPRPARLSATLQGEVIDPRRAPLEHEVKAITYHHLELGLRDQQWHATAIVDI